MRGFFGLNETYMESDYEQFFVLQYHGVCSFIESYNLPIGLRKWYLAKLKYQFELEAEAANK